MIRNLSKVGYFLLGGFVATIGYLAGNADRLMAEQDFVRMKNLHVEERIIVGSVSDQMENYVDIKADDEIVSISVLFQHPRGAPLKQSASSAFLVASKSKSDSLPYAGLYLADNTPAEYKVTSFGHPPENAPTSETSYIVEVMDRQTGFIGENLLIVSADVRLPNGKKIHVEFSNPQTLGMFKFNDKIRIRQKGDRWEFIEHIP